jgi:N-acetylglucosaminyldiphosphoundecaprenol N-acetyl-beta-D-mannosaminyltransferase
LPPSRAPQLKRLFMTHPNTASFLGLPFHLLDLDQAADDIIAGREGGFRYVVTPNVQHMVRLLDNRATLRPLYFTAWRTLCDSRVLSRLARLQGVRLPVATGSDLTAKLLQRAANDRISVAIVGPDASVGVALAALYPGLQAAFHQPKFGFIDDPKAVEAAVAFVVETKAPLVFLAVGTPQQELLAQRIQAHPDARGVGLCIGASIDFLTGKQQRAPLWMQRNGIEWLHRLATNPMRLGRRYFVECPKIFYYMAIGRRIT